MATSTYNMRPTGFPRLDTLSTATGSRQPQSVYQRRVYSYASDITSQPRGKTGILQGYSRFIASLTGEEEVCFQFTVRNDSAAASRTLVAAGASEDGVVISQYRAQDEKGDFGLELLADLDDFDLNDSLLLDCPFIVQYHVAQLTAIMHYDESIMDDNFADAFFDVLIREMSRTPTLDVQNFPHNELSVLNHPPLHRPSQSEQSQLLHAGFQSAAAQYPARHALHFCSNNNPDEIFTYKELDSLSTALAIRLRSQIGAWSRRPIVPAFMAGSPAFYVSWLAVLKAGFAFCPLPMDAPPEQLRDIVEEIGASLVLTNGILIGGSPWDAWYCDDDELATCLDVAGFIKTYKQDFSVPSELPAVLETDLAYVMYTSGSTGRPKGVKIDHFAAACSIASHSKYITSAMTKEGFRWFQFAAPTFDPSIMEIFTTLWTGGTLCSTSREMLLTDPEGMINKLSATIMMATPSMASVLRPEKLHLRHLWTMGEKLTPKVISNFSSDSSLHQSEESHTPSLQRPYRLLNFYGPTEAAINCTVVSDFSADDRGSIIGRPIETCSILIIDANSRLPVPVPLGFSGELAIGGPQVSQGYLNRAEQTTAAFVSSAIYGRLYRTGDRARIVKSRHGELFVEFLGRITTDQVKLSGRRVELGQIETILSSVNGVADAVAVVHQFGVAGQGSEQVVACLVADQPNAEEDLRIECKCAAEKALPAYMQPSNYIFLEEMPRSRSGKTDRKALANIVQGKLAVKQSQDFHEDACDVQSESILKTIIDTLSTVCNIGAKEISPLTDLLSLGLDSLRAVRFLQQIRDQGITCLTVIDVLAIRTPGGLASRCLASENTTENTAQNQQVVEWDLRLAMFDNTHRAHCADQLGVPTEDIEQVLPTTATQSGMIASFLRSMSSARRKYINHSVYHTTTGSDISSVEQAWRTALRLPKILRTAFASVDDELSPFAQCVLKSTASCSPIEFKHYPCSEDEWYISLEKAKAEAEGSISLDRPPLSLAVIRSPSRSAFVLSLFHGIFDGGSLELILRDVEDAFYSRPAAPRTEIDIAVRSHFTQAKEATVAYWNSKFKDYELNPFPCVSTLKPETQSSVACVTEVVGNVTMERILAASRAISVSPLSLLQAAWAAILISYTGSTAEVSFGSVISDRLEEELTSCMGPTFVVAPVILGHTQIGQKTIREVLTELTSQNADALPHHHIPLSSLTTANGGLPYDTLLAFQAFDRSASHTLWQSIEYPAMEHDFAAMIELWPTKAGPLRLRATYTHQIMDQAAATSMLQQFDDILGHLCSEPDAAFQNVPFAVRKELKSQIPALRDHSTFPADAELFLHQPFLRCAIETPEKPALIFKRAIDGSLPDVEWSYGELHSKALGFAEKLLRVHGSVQNEPIMICMEKCPELYVAVIGILLAGGGWCPIDPYSPPARQRAIMERTGSRILVVASAASPLEETAIPQTVSCVALNLADLRDIEIGQESEVLPKQRDPSHLAYLIFTSGTTGLPKGVPIKHLSGAMAMRALAETIPSDVTGGQVRCMQFSQYTFDVFVQDLFYTFAQGGTVISSTRQIMLQSFAELANQTKATHAHLTPAFSATIARSSLKTLEVVTMIGEKLTEAVAGDWSYNMRAYNTYGPAEATVVSTVRKFTGKSDPRPSSNVGIPLPTVGTYVVADGNVVMHGAIGELALAGLQLSPGYWQLPEINAKKFVWNDDLQQTLYLTGDLVRHLADGTINFLGRNDDLVKLGGQRVELTEIAFALKDADPRIEKFEILLCNRKESQGQSMVAFMACPSLTEASETTSASTDTIARTLAEHAQEYARSVLPPYMQPSTFIVLNRIPRTASAKVDRATLTTIYNSMDLDEWQQPLSRANRLPKDQDKTWSTQNQEILSVISEALGASFNSLQAKSNLAGIGIDSIAAIRLVPKINKLGFNLSVIDVFQCRTISDLCQLALSSRTSKAPEEVGKHPDSILQSFDARYYKHVVKHMSHDEFSVIPTTVLQESVISESLKEPEAYWSSHLFQLDEGIDLARLKRSWGKVARQTEALRAGFMAKAVLQSTDGGETDGDNGFLQIIYDEPQVEWREQIVSGDLQDAARQRFSEIALHHHSALFKLPPWAVDIFHTGKASVMMISIHHSIYDGPSLDLLEADLKAHYSRSSREVARFPLSEAVAMKSVLSADSTLAVDFWKTSLQDFVSVAGEEEGSLADQDVSKLQHRILFSRSKTSFARLRHAMIELGLSSIATILRTAWGIILSDLLESPRVLFAEVLSDRITDNKLETAIGPLMSIVPSLFTPLDTVSETLSNQDSFSKQAWTHRNIRPGTIRDLLRRGKNSQVYPAMFAFHPSAGDASLQPHTLWNRLEDATSIQVEHPFALNVWQDSENCPKFELAVSDTLMSEAEQKLLLRQIDALVEAIIVQPKASLTSLTRWMPVQLISKTTPRPDTKCPALHSPVHWVEYWAESHPQWVAAEIAINIEVDGTETMSWTYAELLAESNRIARIILDRGLSGRKIGMCLGRTLTSFAVALGIMISGNAYLPIDEAFPAERKAFLLEDCNAAIIFSTQDVSDGVLMPSGCEMIDVDAESFRKELSAVSSANVPRKGSPGDDSYLLYTSGSTGRPKGVLVSQENLASFVEAQSEFICDNVPATKELGGRGKYLGLASRAFDVHIGEMFLAWRHGLAIVTGNRSMLLDDLALALSSLHISHASFVPSLLDQTGLSPEDAPDLVFLGVGGEKMSPKTKKKWGSHDRVGLINAYGPTEATIGCCSGRLYPDSDMRDIGMPLGDSVGHVLVPGTDEYVLRGMPGELCFTGSLIANGYLNRPDAKGFVDDFQGRKMYRTGDIVRLTIDDHIHFLGRKDDQVKIRGQRVELGEVAEGVRMASDSPVDVAALVVKHPELSRVQLVAFTAETQASKRKPQELPKVVHSNLQSANSVLRSKCQKSLPAYMVPDLIVPLDYIPLTATSGKSDSKLLTQVFSSVSINELMLRDSSTYSNHTALARPMTEEEDRVWHIIASVVKDKPNSVFPSTTVFELGIDSLAAISVFSKLRAAGYSCSVAMVMRNPTIEQLAQSSKDFIKGSAENERLEKIRQTLASAETQFLQSTDCKFDLCSIATVRPCLPLQETLVGSSLHDESYGAYINHIKFDVSADIDVDRLRNAWISLHRDNDILRTCFASSGDTFVQVVLKPEASELQWAVSGVKASGSIDSLQRLAGQDIVQHLTTRPPIRLTFLPSNDGGELLLSISHAIYDGNSLEMMFHDVQRYYEGQTPAARPGIQRLVEYISGESTEKAQQHWTSLLNGWQSAPLLSQHAIKDVTLSTSKRQFRASLSKLENEALSRKVTFATLLQTTFAIALSQFLHTNDFIFGNVLSGRTIPVEGADSIMAPCVTTIPQRVRFEDLKEPVTGILSALQESNSASLEFQHVSPRAIQRWLKADRPLYDVLFSFIRIGAHKDDNEPLLKQKSSDIAVDYPLAIEFEANAATDQLTVSVGFTEAFGTSTEAELMLERIEILTDAVLEKSNLTVESLGITVTGSERSFTQRQEFDESNWTPLEVEVRGLIGEFTSIPVEDIHKNTAFIHLGVDSISAIRLAKCLRKAGLKVSSADVVRHNRLGSLCKYLESSTEPSQVNGKTATKYQNHQTQPDLLSLLAAEGVANLGDDVKCYECTPLQAGMLGQSVATDGALYMHHHAIRCNADIDIVRLRQAWEAVVEDLDVMRTTFHFLPKHTSPWVAVVHPNKRPSWSEVEVLDAREHWLQLSEKSDFLSRIENIQPLANVELVRSPNDLPVLVLSLHHAIYDGISLGMVYRQLSLRYHNAPTPILTPFHEAAEAIVQSADAAVDFWAEQVKGYEGVPPLANTNDFSLKESVVTADIASLEAKCRALDLDIKDVATVAFGKAMMKAFSRRDVVFGHVVAARLSQLGDGEVVGPVFNTIPFRVTLGDLLSTNKNLVDAVHSINLNSIELQHASLAEVQKRWRTTTADPSTPLIDSIFVYSKMEDGGEYGLETLGKPLESEKAPLPSEYRLNFEVEHTSSGFTARALSSAPASEIEVLLDCFSAAVHDIVDNPHRFAAALPEGLRDLPLELKRPVREASAFFDQDATEQYAGVIRNAMADVAEVAAETIELDSSIYSFGIDSIAAIQIVSRCRKAGLRISVAQILKGAVLGRICELVAATTTAPKDEPTKATESGALVSVKEHQSALSTLKLSQDAIEEVLPCLPGQEYHLVSWLESGRTLYEPGWIYQATSHLDVDQMKVAWTKLRERNTVLRTTFAAVGSKKAVQVVLKPHAIQEDAFEVHEFTSSLVDAVKSRAHVEANSPSDLFSLPVRLRLIKAADGDGIMFYCHHALYDAWSMPRLVSELASLYNNLQVNDLPSFSQLIHHTFESTNPSDETSFWKETLSGCEKALLPPAHPPTDPLDRQQSFIMTSNAAISITDLESLCNNHKISPHHILLLAFARALALKTHTTSPLFGFFQLGRSSTFENIEAITGPCVNTLPLGLHSPLSASILHSAREVQALLGARVPFEQSSLRTAIEAFDQGTESLPFNTFVNILWNTKSLIGEVAEGDLFKPMSIGVPTDYSSSRAIEGKTAIDGLDVGILPKEGSLFMDIGKGENGVVFGVRADAKLMDEEGLREFVESVEGQIGECLELLRDA